MGLPNDIIDVDAIFNDTIDIPKDLFSNVSNETIEYDDNFNYDVDILDDNDVSSLSKDKDLGYYSFDSSLDYNEICEKIKNTSYNDVLAISDSDTPILSSVMHSSRLDVTSPVSGNHSDAGYESIASPLSDFDISDSSDLNDLFPILV